jgi:uncharacterized protein YoxC
MEIFYVAAIIAVVLFIILSVFLIVFIRKTSLLIDETRLRINEQSKQLNTILEKIDLMIVDIHSFVKQASTSLEKIDEMSNEITGLVRKVDNKANNVIVALDDVGGIFHNSINSIEKAVNFITNFTDVFTKIKSIFPTKKNRHLEKKEDR